MGAVVDLQTPPGSSVPQDIPGTAAATPHPAEEEVEDRAPQPGGIERAMTQGAWYRMTVREFTAWRCHAQTPLIEASMLRCLERGTDSNTSQPLPGWLAEATGTPEVARKLARAMREHSAPLVALADAQERLAAAALEAATCGQKGRVRGTDFVRVSGRLWRSLCHAAETVEQMQRQCLLGGGEPDEEEAASSNS